jgi:hypothetical protein
MNNITKEFATEFIEKYKIIFSLSAECIIKMNTINNIEDLQAGTQGFDKCLKETCTEFNRLDLYNSLEDLDWWEYDIQCSLIEDEIINKLKEE